MINFDAKKNHFKVQYVELNLRNSTSYAHTTKHVIYIKFYMLARYIYIHNNFTNIQKKSETQKIVCYYERFLHSFDKII